MQDQMDWLAVSLQPMAKQEQETEEEDFEPEV